MNPSYFLHRTFDNLLRAYGPQRWWPAETPLEVMVGAILTQNTAWANVEKAITALKKRTDLDLQNIAGLPEEELQAAIRPSGYYRQKAERLKAYCLFMLDCYGGTVSAMEEVPTRILRKQLLSLPGIGPETADSILLYALDRPVFVVDAYTVRLLSRIGICSEKEKYEHVQNLFTENLDPDPALFNEFHALIVRHCKVKCRKKDPACRGCPVEDLCPVNFKFPNSKFKKTV